MCFSLHEVFGSVYSSSVYSSSVYSYLIRYVAVRVCGPIHTVVFVQHFQHVPTDIEASKERRIYYGNLYIRTEHVATICTKVMVCTNM